jgi:hypothetical protein
MTPEPSRLKIAVLLIKGAGTWSVNLVHVYVHRKTSPQYGRV